MRVTISNGCGIALLATAWLSVACLDPGAGISPAARGETPETEPLRDLPYCAPGGDILSLDLYRPAASFPTPHPLVIHFHRGGWTSGSKSGSGWFDHGRSAFAQAGYAVASVQYRLAPEHPWPAALHDTACAVRFLRRNARELGLDASRFATWGLGAGAHLAAMVGVAGNAVATDGSEHPGVSTSVDAVLALWGPMDLTQKNPPAISVGLLVSVFGTVQGESPALKAASPFHQARRGAPAHLLVHGLEDRTIPVQQSVLYHNRLTELEVSSHIWLLEATDDGQGTGQPYAGEMESISTEVARYLRNRWSPDDG